MIKIGLIGKGKIAEEHIKYFRKSGFFNLIGIYDPTLDKSQYINEIQYFQSIDDLIRNTEAIDILNPINNLFEVASKAIKKSKHIFITQHIDISLGETHKLLKLSGEANVKVQVSQYNRINSALEKAISYLQTPMLLDIQCNTIYQNNLSEASIISRNMIYDIDTTMNIVKSNVSKISAVGVSIVNSKPDIVNVRLEFDNGCVANITNNRIAHFNHHICNFYLFNKYITVNLTSNECFLTRLNGNLSNSNNLNSEKIYSNNTGVEPVNYIEYELNNFNKSIIDDTLPIATLEEYYTSLHIQTKIYEKMTKISNHDS